jgi:hypothetical protein
LRVFDLKPEPLHFRVSGEDALVEEFGESGAPGGTDWPIGHRYASLRLPPERAHALAGQINAPQFISFEQEKSGTLYRIPMAASVPVPLRNS